MGNELSLVLYYSIKLQSGVESLGWRLGEGLVVKLDWPELWITTRLITGGRRQGCVQVHCKGCPLLVTTDSYSVVALSRGPTQKIGKGAWCHLQKFLYVLS